MKITSLRENLRQGLNNVSHVAGKNVNLPILNNLMIDTKDGNIKIIATDLEIGVVHLVRGKIESEGAFTVDSKIVSEYVNLLPNQRVTLEVKEQYLKIECENYKTKIKGMSAEEYPLIPQIEKENGYSIKTEEFKRAVSQVLFAVSNSEARIELTGVLFDIYKGKLTMAATDSYRLAEKIIDIKSDNQNDAEKIENIIVPAKALQELLRIISVNKEQDIQEGNCIKMYIAENQILFSVGPTEIISRLIEGQYPDYKQIIPGNIKTKILLNKAELIRAAKAASLFSKSGINDINLDFPQGKNLGVITSASGQAGENITELAAQTNGEDNGIVVNYKYLLDGLNNIENEEVKIEIVDGNTPCLLRAEGKDDYLYIIMPIKQ